MAIKGEIAPTPSKAGTTKITAAIHSRMDTGTTTWETSSTTSSPTARTTLLGRDSGGKASRTVTPVVAGQLTRKMEDGLIKEVLSGTGRRLTSHPSTALRINRLRPSMTSPQSIPNRIHTWRSMRSLTALQRTCHPNIKAQQTQGK